MRFQLINKHSVRSQKRLQKQRKLAMSRELRIEFLEVRNLLAASAVNDEFVYHKHPQLHVQHLPVLHNDQAEGARIVEVVGADQGGTVRIIEQGRLLSYMPRHNFEGTETFSYALRTPDGEGDSAQVQVRVTRPAVLKGTVWNDRNGDGQRQLAEPVLPAWPVYLDANKNGSHDEGERLIHTNGQGHYQFVVEAGQYEVAQASRPGWQATFPGDASHSVTVAAGQHVQSLDFGDQNQSGSLEGIVWNDRNGDGQRQLAEPVLPAWPVYLDANKNGSHDEGERLIHTSIQGHYQFVVEAGQYEVAQGSRPGWQATFPGDASHSVTVAAGQHVQSLDFGDQNQSGSLEGIVWNDRNGDGQRQLAEPVLPAWPVYLDANKNGSHDEGERLIHTSIQGHYQFVVEAGQYQVATLLLPGWNSIFPDDGLHAVTVEPGQAIKAINFGQGRSEGTLHGTVWADHNGDGQRQAVEPGLPAWPVYLDTNRNGSHDRGERLIHTSRNGHYHFVVEAGQYRVAVLQLPGWNQSFPEQGSHDVTLETGQTVQGLDFGQDQSRAFLHGVVWNDRDGDGQRQEKEHGIPGWPVYLDENGNGSHDSGERLTHTDFSGRYRFVVQVGEHEVAQGSRLGWQATFPGAGSHRVTVESGQHVEGLAFGNQSQAGSLHGVVWNDLNGDGQRQEKEPGIPGWPVYLDGNQNGSHDQGERLVHTNLHGHYGFVVEAGQYQVVQGSRRGWQGTAPENNSFTVDVEAGQHLEGLAFGNQSQFGSLHGSVWYDRNGNGERDHRELGMLGWIVYLDANNNGTREANEQAVRTGSHGKYHFHHVEPGEHVVREMKWPGWQQTAPDEGYHQVVMEPGGVVEEIHFGNRLLHRDRPHARFSMKIIDDTGQVVNKLMRGERFSVETYVEDLRESPEGIRSAELDIVFDDQLAAVTGPPEFVDEFDQERTGESSEGVLDNVGARAANGRTESGPVKLAKLKFRAMQAGEVNFDSLPAHESLTATHLLGDDHGLSSELIDFLGASIEVVANPYVNLVQVHDVDHDQHIAPKDALVLINQLNQRGARKLPRPGEGDAGNAGFFIDVNMDGYHTPIDVMWVINDLNRNGIRTISSSGGEGESPEMPVGGLIAGNPLVARLPRDIQVQRVDRSSDLETISDPLLNAVHQLAVVRDLPARAQYSEDDGDDSAFQHDDLWNWGDAVVDDLLC